MIENESRKCITTAIELEKELVTFETRAKFRGMVLLDNEDYNNLRTKLVNIFSKINSVFQIFLFYDRLQILKTEKEGMI